MALERPSPATSLSSSRLSSGGRLAHGGSSTAAPGSSSLYSACGSPCSDSACGDANACVR